MNLAAIQIVNKQLADIVKQDFSNFEAQSFFWQLIKLTQSLLSKSFLRASNF